MRANTIAIFLWLEHEMKISLNIIYNCVRVEPYLVNSAFIPNYLGNVARARAIKMKRTYHDSVLLCLGYTFLWCVFVSIEEQNIIHTIVNKINKRLS